MRNNKKARIKKICVLKSSALTRAARISTGHTVTTWSYSELEIRLLVLTGDHRQVNLSKSLSYKQTGFKSILDFFLSSQLIKVVKVVTRGTLVLLNMTYILPPFKKRLRGVFKMVWKPTISKHLRLVSNEKGIKMVVPHFFEV